MKHKNIGGNIRYYRKKILLTQQQLADKVGLTWEMISRYERGSSSPMERIEEIASALEIKSTDLLNEPVARHQDSVKSNEIPLFVKLPEGVKFIPDSTKLFYSAPTWIVRKDRSVFAVESSIVSIKTMRVNSEGIFYISPNAKSIENSLVLYAIDTEIIIDFFSNIKNDKNVKIIGVILAQEVRF